MQQYLNMMSDTTDNFNRVTCLFSLRVDSGSHRTSFTGLTLLTKMVTCDLLTFDSCPTPRNQENTTKCNQFVSYSARGIDRRTRVPASEHSISRTTLLHSERKKKGFVTRMVRTHDVYSSPNGRPELAMSQAPPSVLRVGLSLKSPKRFLVFLLLSHSSTSPNHRISGKFQDIVNMSIVTIWRARWNEAIHHFFWVVCVSATYFTTELNIWGLSYVLASAQLQYFGSIVGMILVFAILTAVGQLCRGCDGFYHRWIKSQVCHSSLCCLFGMEHTHPLRLADMVMNNKKIGRLYQCSSRHGIQRANHHAESRSWHPRYRLYNCDFWYVFSPETCFSSSYNYLPIIAITNLVSWVAVFLLTLSGLLLLAPLQSSASSQSKENNSSAFASPFASRYEFKGTIRRATAHNAHSYDRPWQYLTSDDSVERQQQQDRTSSSNDAKPQDDQNIAEASNAQHEASGLWYVLQSNGYVILCILGITAVGIPLELALHDSRALDFFSLWLCWLVATRLQRTVKTSPVFTSNIRYRHALATMINPVLVTTLLMLGLTRMRAALIGKGGITQVLDNFSSGSPLYSILTAIVSNSIVPHNPTLWFGAGDVALSLLECGIVTWGFKLYECRHQLFSISGISTLFFSTIAAAGNVFLSVLLARALGLHPEEALAFAARSATLALAKPAVKTLGGNLALNATLVVSNGILGQLMYLLLLDKLSVPTVHPKDGKTSRVDSPVTVAAGTAIGINGAAMGVSYLYEVKSRAAPYAALSMTMFGVMTVVFTTLEPFRDTVLKLASW